MLVVVTIQYSWKDKLAVSHMLCPCTLNSGVWFLAPLPFHLVSLWWWFINKLLRNVEPKSIQVLILDHSLTGRTPPQVAALSLRLLICI